MNELKPEDVVKALEHCADYKSTDVSCLECPIYGKCFDEPNLLEKAALALLREKDARIEHLEKTMRESILSNTELLENLNRLVEEKDTEIAKLKAEMKILRCEDCWNLAQTEAFTEFEKRLVEKVQLIPTVFNAHFLRLVSQVISEIKGESEVNNNDSVSESKD